MAKLTIPGEEISLGEILFQEAQNEKDNFSNAISDHTLHFRP